MRYATLEDLDLLVSYVTEFARESPTAALLPYDEDRVEGFLEHMLATPEAFLVLLLEGGLFIGTVTETTWHAGQIGSELLYYVRPDSRGTTSPTQVLATYETWAKERGALAVAFHLIGATVRDSFLRRSGYAPLEQSFVKAL